MKAKSIAFLLLMFFCHQIYSQLNADTSSFQFDTEKWSTTIGKKYSRLEGKVNASNERILDRLQERETKIYKTLLKTKDSIFASQKITEVNETYYRLRNKISNSSSNLLSNGIKEYLPWLDSTQTSLMLLKKQDNSGNIDNSLSKVKALNQKLQYSNEIKQFTLERREQLKKQLENLGLFRDITKLNKEVFYYNQQINQYKDILKDPGKLERTVVELLSKTSIFQDFMKKNSLLASLFRMPEDQAYAGDAPELAGLQTRAQITSQIQDQISAAGANPNQYFQQNLQQAQAQLQELKSKLNNFKQGNSDDIKPEGFSPNEQKTKPFLKRLITDFNFQSQSARYSFPVTSDIGLSLGYKINDRLTAGIGTAGKIGWGSSWSNIQITYQGLALRSYVDWKFKGALWISGGYEQNYFKEIKNTRQLNTISAWQRSGLLGISKVLSVKSQLFQKTKIQLLWDFLSYYQIPASQPFKFRIGYTIK